MKESFVTVTCGMSGYFAVMMWWNANDPDIPEGFWEPWQSGIGRYATREEAEAEGRLWAECEGVEFK